MSKLLLLITVALFLGNEATKAQNYNKIMSKAIKNSIGSDLKGYQTFSYPTDNYGLITSYEFESADKNFLCDMWNCIGINPTTIDKDKWLNLNEFAAVGSGGSIVLSQKDQRKIAIGAILPKIYEVIGLTAKYDNDKTTQIDIKIGKVFLRKLRRDPMLAYLNKLDNSSSVKQAFLSGDLVLIVADCVIEDLSVDIKTDINSSAEIDAKIGLTGSTIASKIFNDASLSVSVVKNSNGNYTFKVLHPVVFARLAKKQPKAGYLDGKVENFDDWKLLAKNKYPNPTIK